MSWKINHERIQKAVDRLLVLAQISEPPVPIELIAQQRGVQVRSVPHEGSLVGILLWEGGHPIIGINALHDNIRQRFAIAHELAHLELHHHTGILHIDRSFPSPLCTKQTASGIDHAELEASIVACDLLIPEALLTVDLKESTVDYLDDALIHSLGQRYQVSAQTMLLRVMQLAYW